MTLSERLKELAAKAGDAAQDLAGKVGETAQGLGSKGLAASKEFISKAGAKAQDLGGKGKLLVEIKQLESRAQKLAAQLGVEVYKALDEQKLESVSISTPSIKGIFEELDIIQDTITAKEAELKNK